MILLTKRLVQHFAKASKKNKTETAVNTELINLVHSQKLKHQPNFTLPSPNTKNKLITSALPYVNNKPHLGNIVGAVLSADVYARYCRLMGYNVLYICGTDEYGTATEVKAIQEKTTPQKICDQFHQVHRKVYDWFDISFDHFGRTSKPIHSQVTKQVFLQIFKKGILKEKGTQQLYCENCNLFLADRYIHGNCKKCGTKTKGDQCQGCSVIFDNLVEDLEHIECAICQKQPYPMNTKHLYLQLRKQVPALKQWLYENKAIQKWTTNAKGVTKGWFHNQPQDRCITRDLKWGVQVPIPGYENKVFYVWFQAPLGYISITADLLGENYKKWWRKQSSYEVQLTQFMGKDNILFHSIICPAALKATDSEWNLPTRISATEYLMYEGGKFSKSQNIGVFGDDCQKTGLASEYWRYFLLRMRPETFDSEFSWGQFATKCNKELLNSIGNLINRVLKYSYNNFGKTVLPCRAEDIQEEEQTLLKALQQKFNHYVDCMQSTHISQACNTVLEMSFQINAYIAKSQFWKNPRKQAILGFLVRVIKVYSIILAPFVPSLTAKVLFMLGCNTHAHNGQYANYSNLKQAVLQSMAESQGLSEPIVLIRQIGEKEVQEWRRVFGSHKK